MTILSSRSGFGVLDQHAGGDVVVGMGDRFWQLASIEHAWSTGLEAGEHDVDELHEWMMRARAAREATS